MKLLNAVGLLLILLFLLLLFEGALIACATAVAYFIRYLLDAIGFGRNQNWDLSYRVPAVPFWFGNFVIVLLLISIPGEQNLLKYITINLGYLLIYLLGMYRRFRKHHKRYKEVVAKNKAFIKLCIIPASFTITVLGFYLTATGLQLQNPNNLLGQLYNFIDTKGAVLSALIDLQVYRRLIEVATLLVIAIAISYLTSLPTQLLGYFLIQIMYYWHDNGDGYKELWKRTPTLIKSIKKRRVKRIRKKQDTNIKNAEINSREEMTETETYMNLLMSGQFEAAEKLRQTWIPDKLYKFISLSGDDDQNSKRLKTLKEDALWFAHPSNYNDPYECKAMYPNRENLEAAGYTDKQIESFETVLDPDDIGMVCLSAAGSASLPMWAYYANNSEGFCIEYEVIKKDCIHKVSYEDKRVAVGGLFTEAQKELFKLKEEGKERSDKADFIGRIFLLNFFMKSSTWAHEQEYRIAYPDLKSIGVNIPVYFFGLKTSAVYFGINCTEENRQKILKICKTNKINAYQPSMSKTTFEMEYSKI